MNIVINAAKPVKFSEKAIAARLAASGSLIADVKLDGLRCHLIIKPTADIGGRRAARCYAMSRTNKMIPSLVELFSTPEEQVRLAGFLAECRYPDGVIVDGEALVKGMTFQQSSGRLRSKKPLPVNQLLFYVYGILPLSEVMANDKADIDTANCVMQMHVRVALHQLRANLPEVAWTETQSYDVFTMDELNELYETVRAAGHEGLVIKDPMDCWHRGKKVGWWKMKPEDTIDGRVVGLLWGTAGKKYEGKVIGFEVELEDNGHVVRCDGLTDAQIEEYTAKVKAHDSCENGCQYAKDVGMPESSCSGSCQYDAHPSNNPFYHWAIQVKYMERTEDGSLRHPKFDCWRGTETDPTLKA
ncbi:putative DNA ligase [Aeromonas phage PZL-Ah152]|uniref:DNA ligase n=1 Tax=Aeromonas phage PZL-Ah152 TaxID=2820393 RepID=A0A8A6C5Y9_9CAUD|nr:putative DNA ligase [Aeromonas phage PZL-Ah152]